MKKFLVIALASLFAYASCSKESNETPEIKDNTINLTFTSKKPILKAETKTAWDALTSSIVWTAGDKIRVGYTLDGKWMGQSEEGTAKFYSSEAVQIDESNSSKGTFIVPISSSAFIDPAISGSYTFYAFYPSSSLSNATVSNPLEASVSLPSSQTPGTNTFDTSSDLMVGKSAGLSLSGLPTDAVPLEWTRVVAHADLTFKDFQGVVDGETITKITLKAQDDAKLVGSFKVSVSNGSIVDKSSASNVITIQGTNLAFATEGGITNLKAWVSILPETLTKLEVDVETNKAHYTRIIEGFSRVFKGNARNIMGINMSGATRTAKSGQLVKDGYYVISYDTHMMTVGTESDLFRGTADKNTTNPSEDAIWKITFISESDAYTIHSVSLDKDLYGITTNYTTLKFSSGSNLTNLFTIEKSSSDATAFKISPKGSSRTLGYNFNSGNPRFALYASATTSIFLTIDLTPVTYVPSGTVDNPFSVEQAIDFIDDGGTGAKYVKGIISSIVFTFDEEHETASFWISDDGTTTSPQFEAYSCYFLENKRWVSGNTQIAVGDEVVLYGNIILYAKDGKSIYETESKKAYLFSLKGITSETVPTITPTTISGVVAGGVTGATQTITITNGDGWTTTVVPDGTIVTSASISGSEITYSVSENSSAARDGGITVTLSKAGRTDAIRNIVVSQDAASGAPKQATFNFGTNITAISGTINGVTLKTEKGEGSSDPAYNTSSKQLRLYRYNSMTLSCTSNITAIEITYDGDYIGSDTAANVGTYSCTASVGSWSGGAKSVTITNTGTTNVQMRITKIVVTYE